MSKPLNDNIRHVRIEDEAGEHRCEEGARARHGESKRRARWGAEPDVARVVDGVATPLDKARVKALGNGQVPQVAAAAWRLLTAGKSNTHNAEVTGVPGFSGTSG